MGSYRDVGKGDIRVDEALSTSDPALDDAVDPQLVARVEAWFGRYGVPSEPDEADDMDWPPGWGPVARDPNQDWRRARALEAAAQGELGETVAARGRDRGDLIEPLPPMELPVETPLSRVDIARWGVRAAGAPRTIERPDDIPDCLTDPVPQAVLRDLHRPVPGVPAIELEVRNLGSRAGDEEVHRAREVVRQTYRADPTALAPTRRHIAEDMADLRRRVRDEPWEDARPENPKPLPGQVSQEDLMRWFATSDD